MKKMPLSKLIEAAAEHGLVLVPTEPTAQAMGLASLAVWPQASRADIALARCAALVVLQHRDAMPGVTLDQLTATIATMAPAYRAMVQAAAVKAEGGAACAS